MVQIIFIGLFVRLRCDHPLKVSNQVTYVSSDDLMSECFFSLLRAMLVVLQRMLMFKNSSRSWNMLRKLFNLIAEPNGCNTFFTDTS